VLLAHQDLLFRMSTQLLEEEVLDRDALATLLAEVRPLASLPELPALRAAWAQRELPALPVRLDKAPVFSLPEIDEATDGGEPQA
jgi:hypothetical protein